MQPQVQKLKMDVETEMLGVEQLLRNNTLNMQMMAMVPAVMGLFLVYQGLSRLYSSFRFRGQATPSLLTACLISDYYHIWTYVL